MRIIKLTKRQLFMAATGFCLTGLIAAILFFAESDSIPGGELLREGPEGAAKVYQLDVRTDQGESYTFSVNVAPRRYDAEEEEAMILKIKAGLPQMILGENVSLTDVRYPLNLVRTLEELPVSIEWQFKDYTLIHSDGSLGDIEQEKLPVDTTVTAVILYGENRYEMDLPVRITGKVREEKELLEAEIQNALDCSDRMTRTDDQWRLPEEAGGRRLEWKLHPSSRVPVLVLLGLLVTAYLIYREAHQPQEMEKERKKNLERAYGDFVHEAVLLLGAGMTMRRCLEMMLKGLEKRKGPPQKALADEIRYAVNRLNTGVPESRVYLEFGARTGLTCYNGFSQLMVQNLKKGSAGMQQMMLEQMEDALRRKRDSAKAAGEEAGTKLLLPMMLMLILVLGIVMVPAFLSVV